MAPILQTLAQLSETSDFRQVCLALSPSMILRSQNGCNNQEQVRVALLGVLRDLRGITAATHNKRTYGLLFEVNFIACSFVTPDEPLPTGTVSDVLPSVFPNCRCLVR